MKIFTKSRASAALKFPFQLIERELAEVEASIKAEANAFDPAVEGYVAYVCQAAGKRIRPALALVGFGAGLFAHGTLTASMAMAWMMTPRV